MTNTTTPPDSEVEGELLDTREWNDGEETVFYQDEGEWIQASTEDVLDLDDWR